MRNVYLLDCTLRDGGYVNDWQFGAETIKGFGKKIAQTGVEYYEVGFMKGDIFDPNRAVFPDMESFAQMIAPKAKKMKYVAMLDMSAPVPMKRIVPCDGTSVDGIRVIFKKDKLDLAYSYCEHVQKMGYFLSVNFVGTDAYSDEEFIEGIKKFNALKPDAMAIVDSFGLIKRKQFMRLVYLADNNMAEGIALAYHAHNNLQQAMGNAEALVEMNLKRDLIIDACVFGMGRGAGNLNLELFAEYMNENHDKHYKIEPMLEIMDEYLNDIYKNKFWGYSLPLYLSASFGCHPNYAIYLGEKDTLTVKSFSELLKAIPDPDKAIFSKEKAERYYREYQETFVDDKAVLAQLGQELEGKKIVILAPGQTLTTCQDTVVAECGTEDTVVIALNFDNEVVKPDYIFSSNMRRYNKIMGKTDAKCITTSNMKDCDTTDYVVNFASYASDKFDIIDNSGLMLLKLLVAIGIKEVYLAGMDGYSLQNTHNYYDKQLEYDFSHELEKRNALIKEELDRLKAVMTMHFITPSKYIED